MLPLAQPPRKDDATFNDWMYRLWQRISRTGGLAWDLVSKAGSNLTDIETRNHADLQNINTASYTHLTDINHTNLTDGGDTTLHQHTRYMDVATYDTDADGIVDGAESIPLYCRNNIGVTIPSLSIVYITGAIGQRPTIALAKADAEATSSKTIGVVVSDILNNTDGYIIMVARIHNVNTSAFVDGDALWLSATVAGGLTTTRPVAPNHAVFIGFVAYAHNTQGIITVNIQNGYELDELHNVLITTPSNGQTLTYDSAALVWKNTTPSAGSASLILSRIAALYRV